MCPAPAMFWAQLRALAVRFEWTAREGRPRELRSALMLLMNCCSMLGEAFAVRGSTSGVIAATARRIAAIANSDRRCTTDSLRTRSGADEFVIGHLRCNA